jgi:hypothetical protein
MNEVTTKSQLKKQAKRERIREKYTAKKAKKTKVVQDIVHV